MAKKKCCVRVDFDFIVPMHKLKKDGSWKDKKKEYWAGEWLVGDFVQIDKYYMFRSGKFLLSPSHFDRVKFSEGDRRRMTVEEQEAFLKGFVTPDLHDPDEAFGVS